MTKRKYIALILIIVTLFAIGSFIVGAVISSSLEIEEIKITKKQDGININILHISDLHYPKNGVKLQDIISHANSLSPDLIFLTGDIIDSVTTQKEVEELQEFFYELGKITKTYAVHGNHETINSNLSYYNTLLSSNNIILLNNTYEIISIKGQHIAVVGLSDSGIFDENNISDLNAISPNTPLFLLAHRPEYWEEYLCYEKAPPLLTFSGHAHGGQFKLFGKGVYSPNQGFLPKYYDGLYEKDKNYMIVSRGLGNSIMNLRIYNKYHLPFVTVKI